MKYIKIDEFKKEKAWASDLLSEFKDGAIAKIHWTDKPYKWHVNTGNEVFAILEGSVEMKYKNNNEEKSIIMQAGDIICFEEGEEHVAHPIGIAKILVVEQRDTE